MSERDIFLAVLDLPDPAARAAYLNAACAEDAGRRARVEALLQAHEAAGSFLAEPAVGAAGPVNTEAFDSTPTADGDDEAISFLSPPQRPDSLGRIGHYEVLEVLGRGGFGIVFRAHDEVLQRVVAVKVLAPAMAATSPARKRFLREARSSAQVRHENVVQVYAVEEQPLPYLVMEFIPGETLQQRLDRTGPLDVPEVLRIGRQIAEGLAAAHAQGLIHRDVKPANVMIEGDAGQRVKLTDFGLARAADDASISQSGILAGTPLYMAPEQAKGESLDPRADLFSLGSVLYTMLTGHPPFRAAATLAVLKRVAEDDPRPIREAIPEVPEWLCRIVEKLHAKDPAGRFQTAREVADLLAQHLAHLEQPSKVPMPPRVERPPAPKARRKHRLLKFAVSCFVSVLVACAVWAGPPFVRYLRNKGEVEIVPQPGLVGVIVLQNDQTVHDWMDMRSPHTLTLPAGQYQLNMGLVPGYDYWSSGWEVDKHWLIGDTKVLEHGPSLQLTVAPGERVTVRAVPSRDSAAAARSGPPPASINGTWDSDQGILTLQHGSFGQWTVITVSGFYSVDKDKTAVITRGSYDLENRTIQFTADEPWRKGDRTALLKLSPDGNTLEGSWRNSSGESGVWTMTRRPADGSPPQRATAAKSDEELIQGAWTGINADTQGQPIPEFVAKKIRPTVRFDGSKATWTTDPVPEVKGILGTLANFRAEGVFRLDPTKSPKTIDMTVLGPAAKTPLGTPVPRALLGIYKLDGDSLEICIALDPDHAEDRPTKFESVPGKFISHIKLKRQSPPPPLGSGSRPKPAP